MRSKTTWIMVAGGSTARVLATQAPGKPLSLVAAIQPTARREEIEPADRPGRVQESADSARHGLEARETVSRRSAREFAEQLAGYLSDAEAEKAFDRLILVAAPKLLGDLRTLISKAVSERMIGTMDKDLTKLKNDEIADRLAEIARI